MISSEDQVRPYGLGSLVWLFSPAWDAIELVLSGGWLDLSFRGHRPDLGATTLGAPQQFLAYSRRRIPAFLPFGIKASRMYLLLINECFSFLESSCVGHCTIPVNGTKLNVPHNMSL